MEIPRLVCEHGNVMIDDLHEEVGPIELAFMKTRFFETTRATRNQGILTTTRSAKFFAHAMQDWRSASVQSKDL